ncbi:hypothetical protein CRG98_048168, partial [Punica granatum]
MAFAPTVHPISDSLLPPPAPAAVPLPPTAFLSADSTMNTLPPLTVSMHPPIYTVPPLTVPPVTVAQAPVPTADQFLFQTPQPQISFSYLAPPALNIPPTEPGTPTQVAPPALPTNIPPGVENEQERRIKRMEETIRALQTFQDSLMGSALDWFMTLKAGDVPTWTDLSQKFLNQYRFCAETPPTLLDLSMTEMKEGQAFEAYTTEWRGRAAKHIPPITERQQ